MRCMSLQETRVLIKLKKEEEDKGLFPREVCQNLLFSPYNSCIDSLSEISLV